MEISMFKRLVVCVALSVTTLPVNLGAQELRSFPSKQKRPWWDSPVVQDLNLTEAQQTEIRATVKEYRDRVVEIRKAIESADRDLEAVFNNENPVDQRKASEAIDRLASARGDLTRTLSQMSLKLRTVLTAEQWQELQRRQPGRLGLPTGGRREPGGRPNRVPTAPPNSATKQ
jgi:Spy/CpxP family protein refolding chaperone